jgi:hypothetical protein
VHELAAICDACHAPIADDEGHLYAPYVEIRAHRGDELPRVTFAGIETVIAQPMPIRWYARHYGECTPPEHEIGDLYQIGVEQIRTWKQLAQWTSQLSSKHWPARSDWAALVMACALGRRGRIVQASVLLGA